MLAVMAMDDQSIDGSSGFVVDSQILVVFLWDLC